MNWWLFKEYASIDDVSSQAPVSLKMVKDRSVLTPLEFPFNAIYLVLWIFFVDKDSRYHAYMVSDTTLLPEVTFLVRHPQDSNP